MSVLDVSGLAGLVVALFWIGRTIRADARLTRRWQEIADELRAQNSELAGRVQTLEGKWRRERARRAQLEGVLRDAGMTLPAPPVDDDDATEPETADHPAGGHLIPFPWRSRA